MELVYAGRRKNMSRDNTHTKLTSGMVSRDEKMAATRCRPLTLREACVDVDPMKLERANHRCWFDYVTEKLLKLHVGRGITCTYRHPAW